MKSTYIYTLIAICIMFGYTTSLYAQIVHLGEQADSVQFAVGQQVQIHHDADLYLTTISAETHYENKEISEVVLCKGNELLRELGKSIDYCRHFIMSRGVLSHIVTKYSNVTVKEARSYIKRGHVNIDGYYFDQDYKNYILVIESDGFVIADYRKTIISELPIKVRDHLAVIAGWE